MTGKSGNKADNRIKNRSRKQNRPSRRPVATASVPPPSDRLGQELIGLCANFLTQLNFGTSVQPRRIRPLRRATFARELIQDTNTAAELHSRWKSQPEYLDESGLPKVIGIRGAAPSFQQLATDAGFGERWEHLLSLAREFGLCSLAGESQLMHVSDLILVTGHPLLVFARAVVNIERYLSTCARNAKAEHRAGEPPSEITTQEVLSEEEYALLFAQTRRFLVNFIESTDRQLTAAARRDRRYHRPYKSGRMCGVSAFVFRD